MGWDSSVALDEEPLDQQKECQSPEGEGVAGVGEMKSHLHEDEDPEVPVQRGG